jgi:hypothetical protein
MLGLLCKFQFFLEVLRSMRLQFAHGVTISPFTNLPPTGHHILTESMGSISFSNASHSAFCTGLYSGGITGDVLIKPQEMIPKRIKPAI